MDRLYTPWRYAYIEGASGEKSGSGNACVFCSLRDRPAADDEQTFVLHRGRYNFVVLNIYPYISGHLMVVPFEHAAELSSISKEVSDELMDLAKRAQAALREVYHPHGFNLGMNLGQAAGAGVADHLHLHVMPRWTGDSNFMTTVGETRVIPEDLPTTYNKLRGRI
ncbi:MAG TPA: HIT domain-containing protein [Pyrinomonadaceae bacterium]|nr:HIT domain-containing protein [Pyrinomonadaceae bacterium]